MCVCVCVRACVCVCACVCVALLFYLHFHVVHNVPGKADFKFPFRGAIQMTQDYGFSSHLTAARF